MTSNVRTIVNRCIYISHFHGGLSYDETFYRTLPELDFFEDFIQDTVIPMTKSTLTL